MRKSILAFVLVISIHVYGFATHPFYFEDSLKVLSYRVLEKNHDFERLAVNHEFTELFKKALQQEGSINYSFDSLTHVSKLRAPDGSFRIYTWYIPLQNNRFEFFGFFQSYDPRRKSYEVFPLWDRGKDTVEPQYQTLGHEDWYGAYYIELIHKRHKKNDYYVLLGWRGDNPHTRKRIIEPLRLMEGGRPSFGQPVFKYDNNRHRRIIFEYSSRVSMSMGYESHPLGSSRRASDMIIFDRMLPSQPHLKGRFQFYVPETNVFDAFVFDEGNWIFTPDIDARNPVRPQSRRRN
jgi:hypothetical protein